ncbi:MAG: DNA-protecting protein DprA [Lachnospiraceae bacterium]|nr:DNA-protecting protein DprA [Lachnospiraceae bacterium]MCI9150248.1 DNA-protecting protein DprA [Lachnospiraceae bacterium]
MKYRYWFAALTGVSSREKLELLKIYKSPEEIFWIPEYRLEKEHRIPEKTVRALQAAKRDPGWEASYLQMAEQGVELVCIDQPGYPSRLLHIYDPPYGLFVKGTLPAGEHAVAIVGARGCSVYGQAVAKRLGQLLGEHGVDVVSGLACGIDGAAHRGALEAGGGTWGVLGCGVDICYPRQNRDLYRAMEQRGGLCSESPPGTQPLPYLFPRRNRIISGLADAVVVVEAREKSGSLITADCALEQGKTVYAVPGRISDDLSRGCLWLLSQGACVYYSEEEFLRELGIASVPKNGKNKKLIQNALEKNERLVYSVLDFSPLHLDQIIGQTGLEFQQAVVALFRLQCLGLVKEISKNQYSRTRLS